MKKLAVAAAALLASGCAWYGGYEEGSRYVIATNYHASDALIAMARPSLDTGRPLLMATIVDINDLERSSTLGRLVSENVSARFTQSGYRMVEMKFQNAVYMRRNEGEFVLTREIRDIANNHQAQAVVLGTYSRAGGTVFLNLKVVQPDSNLVLAAQDYALGVNRDVCLLLGGDTRGCPTY